MTLLRVNTGTAPAGVAKISPHAGRGAGLSADARLLNPWSPFFVILKGKAHHDPAPSLIPHITGGWNRVSRRLLSAIVARPNLEQFPGVIEPLAFVGALGAGLAFAQAYRLVRRSGAGDGTCWH
jgi:hypothetical protein